VIARTWDVPAGQVCPSFSIRFVDNKRELLYKTGQICPAAPLRLFQAGGGRFPDAFIMAHGR
jgi:hypothetical protein